MNSFSTAGECDALPVLGVIKLTDSTVRFHSLSKRLSLACSLFLLTCSSLLGTRSCPAGERMPSLSSALSHIFVAPSSTSHPLALLPAPRYKPEFYRQSWIPDLFSTGQACRILGEGLDHDSLPSSMVVEQLLDVGSRAPRSALAALSIKAASSSLSKPDQSWHRCSSEFGCPNHVGVASAHGTFQRVHSIRRPPLLLITRVDTSATQEDLVRHVHRGITQGAVVCNSLVPLSSKEEAHVHSRVREPQRPAQRPYDSQMWNKLQLNGEDSMTGQRMQELLRERGSVYLTDLAPRETSGGAPLAWKDKAEEMVRELVGKQTATGFLLRHCLHLSPGVHSPSFSALFCSARGGFTSPHHNESHKVAAWNLLLRHRKPGCDGVECEQRINVCTAPVAQSGATGGTVSVIHQAMVAKSKVIAGSDHLLDMIDPEGGSRRKSSVRDLYGNSVSLAFGELTEDSSWKVVNALAMTPSSRLLDVGSAFGRFCIHAALASPPGVSVTGIEAGIKRAELASQFLEELTEEHNAIMAPVRPHIRLIQGDIVHHLPLLFAHSHVFLFDARFVQSTWHMLAHLLSYLSGVQDQVVISCQALHKCNPDLVRDESVLLTLSGGKQTFTAHQYRVSPLMKHRHPVEVFQSSVHGLGVRAVRALRTGQTVMRVIGEVVYSTVFTQQSDVSKHSMYPYLTRMPALDKPGKRAFLHALDVSRYINSSVGTALPHNATLKAVDGELYVVAVREIGRGEELLAQYENWTRDGERPWLTDEDLC